MPYDPMKFIDADKEHRYPELVEPIGQVMNRLKSSEPYERFEDMSPTGRLRVMFDGDSDVCVGIISDCESSTDGLLASVEFCTCGAGGGASPRTREALIRLMLAMKLDNEDRDRSQDYKRRRL